MQSRVAIIIQTTNMYWYEKRIHDFNKIEVETRKTAIITATYLKKIIAYNKKRYILWLTIFIHCRNIFLPPGSLSLHVILLVLSTCR